MCFRGTKYLIVVDTNSMKTSKTLNYVFTKMKESRRPHLLSIDWLFDCIEKG